MVNEIGSKIKRLRKERGLTQGDLADRSGVSFRAIQDIELGKRSPRSDTVEMLAQALGVQPGELLSTNGPSSHSLSATVIQGPLTASDFASVIQRLADVSPDRRALALAILFDDAALIPASLSDPRLLSLLAIP